jgi:hypothetical protein
MVWSNKYYPEAKLLKYFAGGEICVYLKIIIRRKIILSYELGKN